MMNVIRFHGSPRSPSRRDPATVVLRGAKRTIEGMSRRSARARPWVSGVAVGGVLVGHAVTYGFVRPDEHARESLLAATGHAYLHLANESGLLLALIALAVALLGRVSRRRGVDAPSIGTLFRSLAGFQVAVFLAMEVLERVSSGATLSGMLDGGLLPLGVLAQLLIAVLGSFLIHHLLRAADRLGELLGRAPALGRRRLETLRSSAAALGRTPALASTAIRAPPSVRR